MRILITGGAGFIGSALIRHIIANTSHAVLNVDRLTYAGNLESLTAIDKDPRYQFLQADICDGPAVRKAFQDFQPDAAMHLAAETHVDRSIDAPAQFLVTNIMGTHTMLDTALDYWRNAKPEARNAFRFHHVSTDEVYGSLGEEGIFLETTPYDPSSPYSASKAASDHLVRAWRHTYGLPVLVTNCSNNYGPYQFPEKLIPLVTLNALEGKELPVYGKGENVRDWLFVEDHARALMLVLEKGRVGETYNIGGNSEQKNIDVVRTICRILDELAPRSGKHEDLIRFVADRPGHDFRYAISAAKVEQELGWKPAVTFEEGMNLTVDWYMTNQEWCNAVQSGKYERERLGAGE